MPDGEFDGLVEDIKKHGQKEAVIVLDGAVLDGWHRYLACQKAGVKCVTVKHDGADPVAFVLSRNLHRRHLTASQRAAAIVAATNWREPGRPGNNPEPGSGFSTEAEMAKAAEVTDRTIRQAKVAHEAGLGDAVRDGKVSAKRAAEIAKLPAKKRDAAITMKPSRPVTAEPRADRIVELEAALKTAEEQRDDAIDTARELNDQLSALEIKDPDEQQKEILNLRKQIAKLEAEVERVTRSRNDCQNKCNELIRQVKSLQRKAGK